MFAWASLTVLKANRKIHWYRGRGRSSFWQRQRIQIMKTTGEMNILPIERLCHEGMQNFPWETLEARRKWHSISMMLRGKIDIFHSVSFENILQECKHLQEDWWRWTHVIVEAVPADTFPKLMTDTKPRSKKLKRHEAGKML